MPQVSRCPQCNVPEEWAIAWYCSRRDWSVVERAGSGPFDGLEIVNITTVEDRLEDLRRMAIRCFNCGYAASFIYRRRMNDLELSRYKKGC